MNIKSKIAIAIIPFTLLSCNKESILTTSEIPAEISEHVTMNFPDNKILQAIKDVEGFTKSYNIILDGGISLEYNRKKEII